MKQKKVFLLLSLVLALSLIGCGQTGNAVAEEDTNTTEEVSESIEQVIVSEDTEIEEATDVTEEILETSEQVTVLEDAETIAIIENAEQYSTNFNFSIKYFEENTEEFFLTGDNNENYSFILAVLEEKTGSSHEQVIELFGALDAIFSEESENTDKVFQFYRNVYTDEELAYENDILFTGFKYADGEDISIQDFYTYIPYYLSESIGGNTRPYSINAILNDLSIQNRSESILGLIVDFNYNSTVTVVPFMQSLGHLAYSYDTFSDLSEHELLFSAPIYVDEEFKWYEHFNGTQNVSYVVPFYDKTADIYSIAFFNADNELVNMQVGY